MHIEIQILAAPLDLAPPHSDPSAGALATFTGTVRNSENGKLISALVYEAHHVMAEAVMHRLLVELSAKHPCLSARVQHRIGVVPVGEAAIHIAVTSRHRAEAFAFLAAFMDRLKQDVPIWKTDALPA